MSTDFGSSLNCRRFDLSTPALIFGGLFLAATAMRGLDASPVLSPDLDDVKVLAEQPTIFGAGPKDLLVLGCQNEKSTSIAGIAGVALKRCKTSRPIH